jgi:hypothetical protein
MKRIFLIDIESLNRVSFLIYVRYDRLIYKKIDRLSG